MNIHTVTKLSDDLVVVLFKWQQRHALGAIIANISVDIEGSTENITAHIPDDNNREITEG